jgi:S-adenosylmethionine:tRNA ribosyltransferase-isomerase
LLVVERAEGTLRDGRITDFPFLLRPGDLLVLNDTKVVPAKLLARRQTGGKVPGLFLEEISQGHWEVLLESSRRLKPGELLHLLPTSDPLAAVRGGGCHVELELLERLAEGRWRVRVNDPRPAAAILEEYGETPLPPYISRHSEGGSQSADRDRYQTVYARRPGAVAAPTAGLHLSEALLQRIKDRGVEIANVTLHVGLGTFKPIGAPRLADHIMHEERYDVSAATLAALGACRARGGRIVAVGTTTVRVLETIAWEGGIEGSRDQGIEGRKDEKSRNRIVENAGCGIQGTTRIFIHPPHRFRLVDALLTNFHLPRSTLLALVMAFAGIELTQKAYGHAIGEKYRFYSYGDAMLII